MFSKPKKLVHFGQSLIFFSTKQAFLTLFQDLLHNLSSNPQFYMNFFIVMLRHIGTSFRKNSKAKKPIYKTKEVLEICIETKEGC